MTVGSFNMSAVGVAVDGIVGAAAGSSSSPGGAGGVPGVGSPPTPQQQQQAPSSPGSTAPGQVVAVAGGLPQGVAGAPNERALLDLMEKTGFTMIQENGQRKYGGPPPGWTGQPPARGCEVFVGKIPRDCYEDELVPVFEKIGPIYEVRLMMDFSGSNRGYCFVMYTNRQDAKKAVSKLNNFEIRKGRFLGVCTSVDNCRLFVGGIPKNKQRDEILCEMQKVTEGVVDVIVYPSATDKAKNRGFAFVEYESHRAAAMARRKLVPGRIQLWNHQIAVDWAEPEQEVDEDIMSRVKILYVRNLMLSTSESTLEAVFNKAAGSDAAVERVKKLRDYAFVHFKEREDALKAKAALHGTMLETSTIEVVLAKPVDKNERMSRGAGRGSFGQMGFPEYPYPPGYDLPFPSQIAFYGQYGAAPSSPGVVSPRVGPGFSPNRSHLGVRSPVRGRGRGAAGIRGSGGRGYLAGYYRTGFRKPSEERLYDLMPDMVLTPTNPVTLKPHNNKTPIQFLENICQKNNWGIPNYELHSTMHRDGSGDAIQLFLYKVTIPALAQANLNSSFQPNKLSRSVDEAKMYAAEYTLSQLGIPVEAGDISGYQHYPPGAIPAYQQY